jgi:hypothetical protein
MDNRICWWCCHGWEGVTLRLPFKIDTKTQKYINMGQFCSWGCMAAFNMEKNGLHAGSTINMLIASNHKKMTGVLKHPKPAPSRYVLKPFGGDLTIEEFRNLEPNKHPVMFFPDQLNRAHVIEQSSRTVFNKEHVNDSSKKLFDINKSDTSSNDSLKLKRSKPLKRDQNNLENMLGLKREKKK